MATAMNKFSAQKVEIDGFTFDSKAEANRYGHLKLLERAKEIKALGVHPSYVLTINGTAIGTYKPDFAYFEGGRKIAEDVKGMITPESSLRMRVFMACYPDIELRIVDRKGGSKPFKQRAVGERRAA
jgi:hypothetical protein